MGFRPFFQRADFLQQFASLNADDNAGSTLGPSRMKGFANLLVDQPDSPQSQGPTDTVPAGPSTNVTLAIGGSQTGVINTAGDHDWYRVELVAGQSYVFSVNGVSVPAASASALSDTYIELWGPSGLVAIDDDGGPGLNSMVRFTATTTGTYYVNVQAYEGGNPTLTGGYQVSAAIGPPQDPLDTIDLGYTVPTQNISVYFATGGQSFNGITASRSWTQAEIDAAMLALGTFSAVTNLNFTQTGSSAGATFVLSLASLGSGVLGQFSTNTGTGVGYGVFAPNGAGWTSTGLQPGGLGFVTLMHEFGHGLGLAHPHDNGGNSEIMQGVTSPFDSYGTYGMNAGIFTTMTYNDGARGYPSGFTVNYGLQGTPGPLDIALLQERYGARANVNAGDNTYVLGETLQQGSRHTAIWDTGGVDTISYSGSMTSTIDLRAATLLNAPGGGGRFSYVWSGGGGYTIANGVTIENATSGSGNDTLFGNNVANVMTANGGDDTLWGGAGADTLNGGSGADTASYVDDIAGVTVNLIGQWAQDGWGNIDALSSIEYVRGSAFNDVLIGGIGDSSGSAAIFGNGGNDWIQDNALVWGSAYGGTGDDTIFGGSAQNSLYGEEGNDTLIGGDGNDPYIWGGDGDDWLEGNNGNDGLEGGMGNDTLWGGSGNDYLEGGEGNDIIIAGAGNDFLFSDGGDDYLDGGDGDDIFRAGDFGTSIFAGGSGIDMVQDIGIWVDLAAGVYSETVTIGSTVYATWIVFQSIEGIIGSSNNESLFGDAGNNTLRGESGDDALVGRDGNDRLIGDMGSDWLVGGDGDDWLQGDSNQYTYVDVYTGGAGADTFDLGTQCGWDVAFDFNTAEDRFSLGGLQWLGFLTIDADGDGQTDDTLLGYAGGNFVALNVTGLSLSQWNALIVGVPSAEDADKFVSDPHPEVLPMIGGFARGHGFDFDAGLDAATRGFRPNDPFILPQDDWGPLAA